MPEELGTIERALTQLLCEHDLSESRALLRGDELIREYPLVRRHGLEHVAARLQQAGMVPDSAADAALELLAFELLGRVSYERVLELMGTHVPTGDVLGICLRAVRLRREATRGIQVDEPRVLRSRLARAALNWISPR